MFLVATRNFPPELGGMQNLMEGLSNALLNHGPVKVFADNIDNAEDYDQNLNLAISENKPFHNSITCSILGMGLDGHTASLFPNSKEVYTDDSIFGDKMIINTEATSEPSKRISYTKSKLLSSKHLFLYFNGKEKLDVFNSAKQNQNASTKPISAFIHQSIKLLNVFCSI